MRKYLKLFVILIVSLLMMVACGDDDTSTGNNGNEQDKSTNGADQTETDDIDENPGEADVETDDSDSSDIENDGDVPVLSIGETGVIEDTLGTYEITPTSFSFENELTDDEEVRIPSNGRYIVVDITFKNIGEETLELDQIISGRMYNLEEAGLAGFDTYPGLEEFEGEIATGESTSGQLAFDFFVEDYYELAFGANMPEHISNEVRWALHAEDAE